MLKNLLFTFLLITIGTVFGTRIALAQAEETFPVQKSTLASANLPSGAQKIRDSSVPAEIKETLAKLVAAGGTKIRQGGSEVIMWTGGAYKKSASAQLTQKLETALQNSGWTYEIGEQRPDFVLFSLFRETPRRALVGFFVLSDDAYIFALTEMLAANAPVTDAEIQPQEEPSDTRGTGGGITSGSGNSSGIVGKWWRGEGSGFIDYTGKTQYKSGKNYTFEFFSDGTVEYTFNLDVLSIVQCRTKEDATARGKYSISGNTLTINLAAGNTVGSSTCEKSNNFRKAVPAATVTKKFTIKRMESMARPDNPWTLCFDGQEGDSCFEKSK